MAGAVVRKRRLQGLLFISPWLVGFLVFTLYPFVSSIYFSLTSYDVISPPEYIGLENYSNMMVDPWCARLCIIPSTMPSSLSP